MKRIRIITAITTLAALSGCSSSTGISTTYPTGIDPTTPIATATLNWDNATIDHALGDFYMDSTEIQTMVAAQRILLLQCALGVSDIPSSGVSAAKAVLQQRPPLEHWLFGIWDVDYVTAQGWGPEAGANEVVSDGLDVDPVKGKECALTEDYTSIDPISPIYPAESEWELITLIKGEAYQKTITSPTFTSLVEQKKTCIQQQGHTLADGSDLGTVYMDMTTWSSEKLLSAALVEATCSDDMGFTQQAANINATFQQELIEKHMGELVAIQKLADERVAQAEQILRDAGVM